MATNPYSPYHLGKQTAVGLLHPVGARLESLTEQLEHFEKRIPLDDADREAIARVYRIVAEATGRVAAEIATLTHA